MPAHLSSILGRAARFRFLAGFLVIAALLGGAVIGASPRSEKAIGPGVRLLRWSDPAGPNAIQAVEVDGRDPLIQLGVTLGGGETLALETISRQAERQSRPERYAIAGVNGDYFYYPSERQPGNPTSAALLGDELVRTPFNRSCMVIPKSGFPTFRILRTDGSVKLPDGSSLAIDGVNGPRPDGKLVLYTPRYGGSTHADSKGVEVYLQPESFPLHLAETHRAKVRAVQQGIGDAVIQPGTWVLSGAGAAGTALKNLVKDDQIEIKVSFDPPLSTGDQVMGGGPRIVRDGRLSVEAEGGSNGDAFAKARHPRTAVGFNRDKVYLVVVDGRQPAYSIGMGLPELAQVMLDLGCTDAINLDGGGSSTLWVRGSLINRPSDGRERPVANGLLVFSTAPREEPVRLAAIPEQILALAGAEVPISAADEDRYFNPVPVPAGQVEWKADPGLGRVADGRFIARIDPTPPAGQEYASGTLTALANGRESTIPVRVYPRPVKLVLQPATARLAPGAPLTFRVRALDSGGALLALPPTVTWTATPEIGTIDVQGKLTAGALKGKGSVRVTVNGVSSEATVEVTTAKP